MRVTFNECSLLGVELEKNGNEKSRENEWGRIVCHEERYRLRDPVREMALGSRVKFHDSLSGNFFRLLLPTSAYKQVSDTKKFVSYHNWSAIILCVSYHNWSAIILCVFLPISHYMFVHPFQEIRWVNILEEGSFDTEKGMEARVGVTFCTKNSYQSIHDVSGNGRRYKLKDWEKGCQPYGVSHFTHFCSQEFEPLDFLFSPNPALCQTCVRKSLWDSTTCLMAPFLPCFPPSSLGEKWIGRMVRRRLNHLMVRTKNDLFDARHPAACAWLKDSSWFSQRFGTLFYDSYKWDSECSWVRASVGCEG